MSRPSARALVVIGLMFTLLLAGVASFYASSQPDGLEHVAEQMGFESTARDHAVSDSPLAGYGTKGISSARLSGGVAGVVGVLVVGLVGGGLAWGLRRRGSSDDEPERAPSRVTR